MPDQAARTGDLHQCTMVSNNIPHTGGMILPPGASTVLIGGAAAARISDSLFCVGPPDTIITGSSTVLIEGLPAARVGDSTMHGGKIILGCPTVLIG